MATAPDPPATPGLPPYARSGEPQLVAIGTSYTSVTTVRSIHDAPPPPPPPDNKLE
jgi:hypothetical protein